MKYSLKKWVSSMKNRKPFMGLGKVFKFTLWQLFKNKGNLVVFGILIVVAMAAVPVMAFLFEDEAVISETGFVSSVMTMEEFLHLDEVSFDARYMVQIFYSVLVLIVCVFSCAYIIRSIVEEKASKLVETLMVSVESEALILGKVLAVMAFIFGMLALTASGYGISYLVTGMFMDTSVIGAKMANMGITAEIFTLGPALIAIIVVSLLLAYMQFALIAALSGAGCSNIEDMEGANTASVLLTMAGYIVTIIASPFGSTPAIPLSLCPFISAFAAPTYYVTGDIGIGILILSWAIQVVIIAAESKLSASLYDSLIMYKGNRLKLTQMLAMAVKNRKGAK